MKEMTLQDIQSVSLDILKDVHNYCIAHDIKYTLFGGTMIGAIRHKGFIPWDDDIDVAMPRPDYERFINEYVSERGYELICEEKGNSLLAFARIVDKERTIVKASLPWTNQTTGVCIDVFPLDGAPDDKDEAKRYISSLRRYWTYAKLSRVALRHLSDYKSVKTKMNILVRKILFRNPICRNINWTRLYSDKCKQIPYGSTRHFANVSFMEYGMKEYQETADFETTVLVDFEDEKFCVCNGYDHLMRVKYGDYMQLPPEKDRIYKHGGSKYYWK